MAKLDPSKLTIVHYPDPVLRKLARRVERFTPDLAQIVDRMFGLMHESKGVGLAAPQVGLSIRVFVFNATGEPQDDRVVVNPELSELMGSAEAIEGCLSLPNVDVHVLRATRVVLRGFDLTGGSFESTGEDMLARIWQHENDHLHGRLIIDRMSESDEIANQRAIRAMEAKGKPSSRGGGKTGGRRT